MALLCKMIKARFIIHVAHRNAPLFKFETEQATFAMMSFGHTKQLLDCIWISLVAFVI